MNAREHLTGLLNSLCGAGPQCVEGTAAWPIDASQPEDVRRHAIAAPKIEPARFGGEASAAALAGGAQRGGLVDPAAAAVAVNSGRGEIADPEQALHRGDVLAVGCQHRIARSIGRNGGE